MAAGNVEDRSLRNMGERAARDQIAKSLRFCLPNKALSIAVYTEKKMQKVSEKTAHGLAERGRRQHMRCQRRQAFAKLRRVLCRHPAYCSEDTSGPSSS